MSIKYSHKSQSEKKTKFKERKKKVLNINDIPTIEQKLHNENLNIVFTHGTFDLLNPAHCRWISEAASCGDILVVGIANDTSVTLANGEMYPLISEQIRMEMISYINGVDYVTIVDEVSPHGVLSLLKPNVYYTHKPSWDAGERDVAESLIVKNNGGKIVKRELYNPYFGTLQLVDHIANIRVLQIMESFINESDIKFSLNPDKHLLPANYGNQKPSYKAAFDPNDLIIDFADLPKLHTYYKNKNKKTVLVSGSYDLLHAGHTRFIEKASLEGDILIVGIPSDKSLRASKGVGRPIISQHSRAYTLAALDMVDHVVIFDDWLIRGTLKQLKPDVFFTVDESWNSGLNESEEAKIIKSYGGSIVLTPRQSPFLSSSGIINKVASRKVYEIFSECIKEAENDNTVYEKSSLNEVYR